MGEDGIVAAMRTSSAWQRYAWVAGILYVIALVAVSVVGLLGGGLSQNGSAAKIATALYDHRGRLLVVTYLSVVYAAMFPIYLSKLYDLLRRDTDRPRFLGSLVLVGGALFVALHAVSDIGIFGLLGAKLASFGFQHDQGVSYTLYLMTYAFDSVGDVFGSLFAFAAGLLVIGSGVLPRWLGWVSILAGILFFLQGFGLGGVIASFGLVLDLIGFVLFLIFVLVSSVILLTRKMDLGWARGSGPWPSGLVRVCESGAGQAVWVFASSLGSGSAPGRRQRVTSKPRAPILPTWWRTCRLTSARRS